MKVTTNFTKLMGFAFILLSVLRLTPIISVNGKLLLCFGIAALLLILSDLFEFIIEGFVKNKGFHWEKALEILHYISLACAAIAIIVLPNLKIGISVKEVNAWSDTVTLAGLGIAITLIGLKHERMQKRLLSSKLKNKGEGTNQNA
ncbi:hypothetical protein [Paenibacillus monticola]|uniref:Uncharacterized protein n=1 Tax=Paenibacillus monticola TaxID=2666075 RepID=A0A7X2HB47_9BACL|nr:hypothetical protein [Paenibacillus monticola]MRN56746.1 hypothetical protein [Paenibacillus monticola]